ncbi:MAG: class I SAM-dependent methyltransferase [Desulfobacterales bacterium]|nr:class I SAM-dependent methyltransferase [Desulfobacterales bacterium]
MLQISKENPYLLILWLVKYSRLEKKNVADSLIRKIRETQTPIFKHFKNNMHNKYNTLNIVDKNYLNNNLIIKFLLKNFLNKNSKSLKKINAYKLKGLDVGCGEAHLLSFLFKNNVLNKITALDINYEKLIYAKNNYSYFDYIQSDIHNLPFNENSFDYVIANEVLEHIRAPYKAMLEFKRISKKDGWILISVPHEPFFCLGNILRGKYLKNGGKTPSHMNFWRKKEFEEFIDEFVIIKNKYWISVFPWLLYLGKVKK